MSKATLLTVFNVIYRISLKNKVHRLQFRFC